jgi:hypothetical protein
MSRFTASVGPLEQPPVTCQARISPSQARTVRASRDSSATPSPSASGRSAPGGAGRRHADRGVDGPQQLLALPGSSDLTRGITSGQPGPQPHPSSAGELLGRGQQQLADAVQGILFVAPVAQGGLLGPAADLVDHQVGQADGVEVVHDHGRMTQWDDQGAGIAAPGIEGDHGDLSQPGSGPGPEPAVHRSPGPVGDHIQQPTTLQIHQTSDVPGRCCAGGLEEAGLIQPERGHPVQAGRIFHQRGAVIGHRPHHRRPANPQIPGDRGDRVGVLADPPARLGPGPLGQHRPSSDHGHLLGPGPDRTGRFPTTPHPFAPDQHHRAATDRQVPHPDRTASMQSGPAATGGTAHRGGGGLDRQSPLLIHHLGGGDLEAVQAEQDRP